LSWKRHFTRCLDAAPGRLHFAAHSHHPWPDVTFEAQQRAWLDAAERLDLKWEAVFADLMPRARGHVARVLRLTDPATVTFAPNTHELVVRVLSCIERSPARVLTTDGEFHSFRRQARRWAEAGRIELEQVPVEPFETFSERFLERARENAADLVYVSHVFFGSGFVFEDVAGVADAVGGDALVVIDGYHRFFALPTDLAAVEDRVFYTAGGYKYAMSGEGACFLHCPPGRGDRPVDTGWYAGFDSLERSEKGTRVGYARDGSRFLGATFDPTALYRFDAAMSLWEREGVSVADIHAHVRRLQQRFLERLDGLGLRSVHAGRLVPGPAFAERGHFLTFRVDDAAGVHRALRENGIVTDHRDGRLRFGFGVYQDEDDVDELAARLGRLLR
jgi:selenocysteine lyase/cysteine desulfurase